MKIAFKFFHAATTFALFGLVTFAAFASAQYAHNARSYADEANKAAKDVHKVTITVTVTGTDAASRATVEKIVNDLKAMEPGTPSYSQLNRTAWR
jgi:ABC-type glycerol-3-phosphate transport system substrate-binding protein